MNEPEDIFSLKAALDSQSIEIEELQEEIKRLRSELERNAETTYENHKRIVAELTNEVSDLKKRISEASIIMCDWDGFFDPKTQSGNTVELAKLIDESYRILNGRSWNKEDE